MYSFSSSNYLCHFCQLNIIAKSPPKCVCHSQYLDLQWKFCFWADTKEVLYCDIPLLLTLHRWDVENTCRHSTLWGCLPYKLRVTSCESRLPFLRCLRVMRITAVSKRRNSRRVARMYPSCWKKWSLFSGIITLITLFSRMMVESADMKIRP